MKIDSLSSGRSGALRKSDRGAATGSDGAFARSLESGQSRPAPSVAGPASLGRIDGILALQEVPDPSARRKRAVQRAEELLEELDQIRLGLLGGRIPLADLRRLAHSLAQQQEQVEDPRLAEVLAEIELRAAVELAKYES